MNTFYGLDNSILSFAIANNFVQNMNKGSYALGKSLQPFCFFADEHQRKYNVVDITDFAGFIDSSKTLVKEIADYRRAMYNDININAVPDNEKTEKAFFLDYLLTVSICYVEVPKSTTKNGLEHITYDKFFATRNPKLMATWTGLSLNEVTVKYAAKVEQTNGNFYDGNIKAVRLTTSQKGNSISCPRNAFNIDDIVCVPLFMLYAFENGMYEALKTKILNFKFLKDNRSERDLATTLNFNILLDYYSDNVFIGNMLERTDIFTVEQGGMRLARSQSRGYIKVPELGASKYDLTGVRSLNIARLLKIEELKEVDRTFINVNLNIIIDEFQKNLERIMTKTPIEVLKIHNALKIYEVIQRNENESWHTYYNDIIEYLKRCDMVYSTTFRRELHRFMIMHPEWFPLYTGDAQDNIQVTNSANFGVEIMNF